MSRLVGDLILLAKTNRPDFLALGAVDLAELTEDVQAKARGLGDRVWAVDATREVELWMDEQRITQALLQLADNAVKHTHEGDEIAIGSSYDAGAVRLWVRDTGPGVPADDREQIFERFGRSRVPEDDEGFGLGLSIVRAIAGAHGGVVAGRRMRRRGGARFVITLPRALPATRRQVLEGSRGPDPDRGGRGADRVVPGQGAALRGPRGDRRPPTGARASTTRSAATTTW